MQFDFESMESREIWEFSNSNEHNEVRQAILAQKGLNQDQLVLYPVNWNDWDSFALRHQAAHDEVNAELGIGGSDLTRVDLKNKLSLAEWNLAHFSEHQSWRAVLKI